jgi:phage gp46-like protein
MKLGESVAAARRIGPLKAVDEDGVPVTDFSDPGAALISVNNGAWAAPAGAVVPILNTDDSPSGLVYYQGGEDDASVQGFASVRLAEVCLERVFTEYIEPLPQGIPAGTEDEDLLHVGPLEAKDEDGNPVLGGAGIDVHITINGAKFQVPANALTEILDGVTDRGFYDLLLDPSEVPDIGWTTVRIGGACQEFVMRVDVVDPANLEGGEEPSPSVPVLPDEDETAAEDRVAGDLALVWSTELGDADLSVIAADIDEDLATDRGLQTAVLLSLFTDRRAETDDKPPSGDATDRRGWWADQFAADEGDRIGSRLWLLDRSKRSNEVVLRATEYAREALAWMLEDRVVSGVDVAVDTSTTAPALFAELRLPATALLITVGLQRPGKDPVSFHFAHTWDHLQETA